jgi:hypothetical protein
MSLNGVYLQFPLDEIRLLQPQPDNLLLQGEKNKEGCKAMTLNTAEGLPLQQPAVPASNQGSLGIVTQPPEAPKREAGWDPQEVWRTRVKSPSNLLRARFEWDRR